MVQNAHLQNCNKITLQLLMAMAHEAGDGATQEYRWAVKSESLRHLCIL